MYRHTNFLIDTTTLVSFQLDLLPPKRKISKIWPGVSGFSRRKHVGRSLSDHRVRSVTSSDHHVVRARISRNFPFLSVQTKTGRDSISECLLVPLTLLSRRRAFTSEGNVLYVGFIIDDIIWPVRCPCGDALTKVFCGRQNRVELVINTHRI